MISAPTGYFPAEDAWFSKMGYPVVTILGHVGMALRLGRDENIDYAIGKGAGRTQAYVWSRDGYTSVARHGAKELKHSG